MTLRRILFLLIAWCVLPLFVLATALAGWHVVSARSEHEERSARLAANAAAVVDRYVQARVEALALLARSPLADDPAQPEGLYRQAQAFVQTFDGNVALVSAERRMIFNTNLPLGSAALAVPRPEGRSALQGALDSAAPAVGDLFRGAQQGEPLVAMAAPVLRAGRPAFVLLSLAGPRQFERSLAQVTLPSNAALALRDSRGQLIARVGAPAPEAAVTYRATLGHAPWQIDLVLPRAEIVTPLAQMAGALAAALLVATLAGISGGLWAARRLAGAVGSLAAGDDRARPPVDITEVEAARATLRRSAEARAEAEQRRRASDAQYRQRLEQASLALQASEATLRGVFDAASEAIVSANAAQFIVMANPAAARMFRCPAAQLVGRPLASLLPERHRGTHEPLVRRYGQGGDGARRMRPEADVMALRADGEEFPVEVGISHVHIDGRELFTAIVRDVTERRRAQAELLASKTKLETALASMNDAVMITDAAGRIVEFNQACVGFHRFTSRAQCRATLDAMAQEIELCHADGSPAAPADWPVARALRGEAVSMAEYRLRRKAGGEPWIASYGFAPIRSADGGIDGAVVTAHDITELKRSQAALQSSHEALQRLLAAQDRVQEDERQRIARELHDDLQQTLAAITMEVAAARRDAAARSDAEATLARIHALATAGIVSTRRIVNDLRPRILEDLGLAPALEALAATFAQRSGIACEFHTDLAEADMAEQPPALATCLYRVAQEALNNVGKHAGARRVRIALVHLAALPGSGAARRGRLRLVVADDGRGHAPGDLRKPGSYGLLGMGERVRALGGTLRVAAPDAGGTTVEVEVELPPAAA
ncbi:MAG: PAS domain S-box protein [Rubrivivax sp.]|nr:PAS domain S-box protein [Rubrivivax sp.]